jgi:hypothetical protein
VRELNQLIYGIVKTNSTFSTNSGQTSTDSRVFKNKTPVHIAVSSDKPAYVIYRHTGSAEPPNKVYGAQRNDYIYTLEIYCLTSTLLSTICDALETAFEDKKFSTANLIVSHSMAYRGAEDFDESRQAFYEVMTIHLDHIFRAN